MKPCVDSEKEKQMTFSLHSMDRVTPWTGLLMRIKMARNLRTKNRKHESPLKNAQIKQQKPENISPIVEGTVNKKNKSVQCLLNQSSFMQQIFSEHLPCPGLRAPWKTSQTGCFS